MAEIDFTSSTGNHIEGTNFYISFPDKNVTGEKCERVFASTEVQIPDGLEIGKAINLYFNHKGKLEAITK